LDKYLYRMRKTEGEREREGGEETTGWLLSETKAGDAGVECGGTRRNPPKARQRFAHGEQRTSSGPVESPRLQSQHSGQLI
jgi:hypothetical protein